MPKLGSSNSHPPSSSSSYSHRTIEKIMGGCVSTIGGPRSKSGGHAQDDVPPPPYTPDSLRKNGEDGKSSEKDCDDSGVEDALETLRAYDTFFLIDDSGSMTKKRWHEARDAVLVLAKAAARYDADGIDVFFLNSTIQGRGLKRADDVIKLFNNVQPQGATPTARRLEEVLSPYLAGVEKCRDGRWTKPLNLVVITDGAPTDDPESTIIAIAKRLDRVHAPISQLGIQFVQVGNDKHASDALRELDDSLGPKNNVRDMVDTTLSSTLQDGRLTGDALVKALVGGINRRVDKKGYGLVGNGFVAK